MDNQVSFDDCCQRNCKANYVTECDVTLLSSIFVIALKIRTFFNLLQ